MKDEDFYDEVELRSRLDQMDVSGCFFRSIGILFLAGLIIAGLIWLLS